SHFDPWISFGTDFQRFIRLLPTPDRQCKLFTFSTRLKLLTFDGQCCFAPIITNKSMLWKSHLGNYTDVCRGSTIPSGTCGSRCRRRQKRPFASRLLNRTGTNSHPPNRRAYVLCLRKSSAERGKGASCPLHRRTHIRQHRGQVQ